MNFACFKSKKIVRFCFADVSMVQGLRGFWCCVESYFKLWGLELMRIHPKSWTKSSRNFTEKNCEKRCQNKTAIPSTSKEMQKSYQEYQILAAYTVYNESRVASCRMMLARR